MCFQMTSSVPVMILFGTENSKASFCLYEVERSMKLSQLLEKFRPDDWGDFLTSITTRVSQARSSTYDKFNLNNSVDLVLRVFKTDVIWIKFEKDLIPV